MYQQNLHDEAVSLISSDEEWPTCEFEQDHRVSIMNNILYECNVIRRLD